MIESCLEKHQEIKDIFLLLSTPESRYEKIIEMGRALVPLKKEHRIPENIVKGCQSILYLRAESIDGKLFFKSYSDAMISLGLSALLIAAYDGESPETILKCSPDFLHELGIFSSLSPNRSNGLWHIHLRMKQDALKHLSG